MPHELATRLDRIVAATFRDGFTVLEAGLRENPPRYSVLVGSTVDPGRTACLRLDGVWLEAFIPELDVQCGILDGDEEAGSDADSELGRLFRALRMYLRGAARIGRRRRFLRHRKRTVLRLEIDGQRWRLGRNRWSVK